mgnify:CR=1 FL=1
MKFRDLERGPAQGRTEDFDRGGRVDKVRVIPLLANRDREIEAGAAAYVLAQCVGGVAGVLLAAARTILGGQDGGVLRQLQRGLGIDESVQVARWLEADGALDALELTGGSSLLNGMYFFRGDVPLKEFRASQPAIVGLGLKFYGPKLFPKYPYEEGFFLPFAASGFLMAAGAWAGFTIQLCA